MVCLPEYKRGRAETCEVYLQGDKTCPRYFVRMPDGKLVDCGLDFGTAKLVADSVNVVLKWVDTYPPYGVIESIVRNSFADEDRMARSATERET